jgi:hypothetical protein
MPLPPISRNSYVVDGDGGMNNRLLKIGADGSVESVTGNANSSLPGLFDIPHNIVMDDMRRLWVADRANMRLQVRSPAPHALRRHHFRSYLTSLLRFSPCGLSLHLRHHRRRHRLKCHLMASLSSATTLLSLAHLP